MNVIMYTKKDCGMCIATGKWLDKRNIEYRTVDLTHDDAKMKRIAEESGKLELPIVKIYDNPDGPIEYVSGFRPEELEGKIFTLVGAHK